MSAQDTTAPSSGGVSIPPQTSISVGSALSPAQESASLDTSGGLSPVLGSGVQASSFSMASQLDGESTSAEAIEAANSILEQASHLDLSTDESSAEPEEEADVAPLDFTLPMDSANLAAALPTTPLDSNSAVAAGSVVAAQTPLAPASPVPEISSTTTAAVGVTTVAATAELATPTAPAPVIPSSPPTPPNSPPAAPSSTPAPDSAQSPPSPVAATKFDPNKSYGSLPDVLSAMGVLDQAQVSKLLVENISTGKSIEQLVVEQNLASEDNLTQAKAAYYHVPYVRLSETGIFPEALNQIPEGVARNYSMLPFAYDKEEKTLSVAMRNPLDLAAIDFAEQKSGLKLKAFFATPTELERMIAEYYSQTLSSEVTAALEQTVQMAEVNKKKENLSELSGEMIRQAPITKIVQTVLAFAMKARASDIHIEPLEDRTRVRYRIDGILNEKLILPSTVHDAVVSRIKILSGLKIDEKRLPQDGRFNFSTSEEEVDLRISTLPTINGEKIVMRLLKKDQNVPTLPELGLNGIALRNVQEASKVPHGIVLVTGPTGSGKTTTLYSMLHRINTPKVNIMTLEDPVEYQMAGVNQVQINPQAGLTFASGLRSFLRQDPNIIMVGEIRDSETAELAVQASLTGHLVFSTLHTSSAAGAIPRLMDMGAEPFLLASSMTLVMAQRVLRKINEAYKEEYKPEPEVLKDIQEVLGDRFGHWCQQKGKKPEEITLFRPKKERPDTEPEFKGRVAIFEVMKISEAIAKMILERKPAQEMEKLAIQEGMFLMKQDGYMKVLEGVTTIEEVLRVAQI
jgi:type IV pilus assembly protein PilB